VIDIEPVATWCMSIVEFCWSKVLRPPQFRLHPTGWTPSPSQILFQSLHRPSDITGR